MALQEGVNCYVSFADADDYFEDRLDSDTWSDATDLRKERALVTATMSLDRMSWAGVAVSETQNLAFPRTGTYFNTKLGYETSFPDDVPDQIKTATYELAFHLLNNEGLQDSTGDVKSIKVGTIELIDIRSPGIPKVVRNSINEMLAPPGYGGGGGSMWWRAN